MLTCKVWLRWRRVWLCGGVLVCAAALLYRPQAVATGISRGLSICSAVLIPSLFPFLVLGGFLIRSGLAAALGRRLERVTGALFGLPGCCAAGIVIGAVGGYPSGGVAVGELIRSGQISRDEGRRMLWFCVNGGPGFIISAVGAGLMGNIGIGAVLFAAHLLAALLIGVVSTPRGGRRVALGERRAASKATPSVAALVESVSAACESLFYMCGFVLLWSAVLSLLDVSGVAAVLGGGYPPLEKLWSAVFACVLEVGCGCTAAAGLSQNAVLLLAFAVGFGGLSVHCQLASALRDCGIMDRRFFMARLAQGALTVLFTKVLLRVIPLPQTVFGDAAAPIVHPSAVSVPVSIALLVLGGVWMLTVGHLDKKA